MLRRLAILALLCAIAASCSTGSVDDTTTEDPTRDSADTAPAVAELGARSERYADPALWLCRPDTDDVCDTDLDATALLPGGTTEPVPFSPAADPPVDCFYVYPTISRDPGSSSDLEPGVEEEEMVVRNQAARLGESCRVFAPMYRQRTLAALAAGESDPDTRDQAFDDVAEAFDHYLATDGAGRGVVLVGHSQGAGLLLRLLQERFDGDPAMRERLVSALLIGSTVAVPAGKDVGGALAEIPLCRADDQIGCVVTYATFRASAPPPADSFFGRVRSSEADGDELVAGCTNPGALAGGEASLTSFFPTADVANRTPEAAAVVDTPFVMVPGAVTATCVERDGFSYLEVVPQSDPGDPWPDDVGGDLTPVWGLHLVDVNLAMGDLVELVGTQGATFSR
jgi:pimeloyl-ACP methyl ester carboxylesterase